MAEGNMTNSTNQTVYNELTEITHKIDLYVTPILYIVGFPGNIFSLVIWLQKRMRHSSGCYLAALALDDLIFLVLHFLFELHKWKLKPLDYPVICEGFPIFFLASQLLSPFLVLAFTTERYISICHPFQREKYCTVKRAKIVIICMVAAMPCLNAVHGYFWKFDEKSECNIRSEVVEGQTGSLYVVYTMTVDVLAFFIVPLSVLVLNMLVIREMRRLSRMDTVHLHGQAQRTGSTTVMLLAVSFYQIITTLPISIAFAFFLKYSCDSRPCDTEEDKRTGAIYQLILAIITEYGITHYAFNIFIYVCTGKMFRQELKKLICYPINKLIARLPMDYTSLRTKARGSEQSRNWVSTNGNHDNERTTEETLL
ncbi:unnamed protein product [Candidula unifasciata]|uniref:G-protein coupled receptors family 1 profile domain-containing protein n=1 Tax=Candidula unifasciata TaxID=100452 RepID=A0A8S3YNT2_9EUPU|nr:unnamed protein product [Candidula unifasciata]